MSESGKKPTPIDVIKEILLPGSGPLMELAGRVKNEARETDGTGSINRILGMGVISIFVGVYLFIGYFIYSEGIIWALIDIIGIFSFIVLVSAIVLTQFYVFILILKQIDDGESVFSLVFDEKGRRATFIKVISGGASLFISISLLTMLDLKLNQMIIFSSIFFLIVGTFVAGLSCVANVVFSDGLI